MKIGSVDLDKDILIVAEIGNNHEGKISLAEKLVVLAAKSGAKAVKFQTFKTEQFTSKKDPMRFKRLKGFELTFPEFKRLSRVAHEEGLMFFSTPLDLESAAFLGQIVYAFKISSGDNTFYPLIEQVAKSAKPIIISSGLLDLRGILRTKSFIERVWKRLKIDQQLAVLHCVVSYPVPKEEAGLLAIPYLKRKLGCTVGYSDHTIGIEAAVLSAALGARIIEKHFTIDKHYSEFRDHRLSADPKEMKELVRRVSDLELMLGKEEKIVQKSEESALAAVRRSIAAKRDLAKGSIVGRKDIIWIRPAGGVPPGKEHLVIGKSLRKALAQGELLLPEFLDS